MGSAGLPIGPDPGLVARHRMLSGSMPSVDPGSGTYTPAGGRVVPPRLRAVSMWHLMSPKWLTVRAGAVRSEKGRVLRWLSLTLVGALFWSFAFGAVYRVLSYFKGVPEIGPLLAGKLLGILLLAFSSILLLSNVITALSSFFLARDLDMLVSAPVDWLQLYGAKLLETTLHSSWMVLLLSIPIFCAYGMVYDGGFAFVGVVVGAFVPFLLIPSVVGSALTLVLVNIFPARRTRDILSVITVIAGAGVVVLFRLLRPEKLARPEGFRSLVEFISILRGPTSPLLPSEWVQRTIMGWLTWDFDALPLYLLWSTAAAFVVLGALLHRAFYARGFSKAQEGAQRIVKERATRPWKGWELWPFGVRRRELVLKELRIFFRDTTQWSQLILLGVLLVVYVVNIKFLPLSGEGVTFFIVNLIPFLNLALAGFVLASIAARFLFPGVSLEGRSWWLVRSSPMAMQDLLWAKFWVGTLPLLVLALAIVVVTNILLQVSAFMFVVSVGTITLMTFAIAGLALGFGTLYPRFETENAAQIPTSFGGLMFMMTSVCLIGGIIVLEARPVYTYLSARTYETEADPTQMIVGFTLALALCLTATFLPLRLARRRLESLER
ncbi:MAG: putative ABC transporter permease subunit [Gemmatimonadaceae bacterium]